MPIVMNVWSTALSVETSVRRLDSRTIIDDMKKKEKLKRISKNFTNALKKLDKYLDEPVMVLLLLSLLLQWLRLMK